VGYQLKKPLFGPLAKRHEISIAVLGLHMQLDIFNKMSYKQSLVLPP
jgi:hypothetical protein